MRRFRISFKFDKGEGVENLCGWGDDINSAENEIGDGDAIIVFVSRKYLMSPHTMKEWHSIVKKGNLVSRVYPVCIDHPLRLKLDGGKNFEISSDFYYDYIPELWNKSLKKLPPEYIQSQFQNSLEIFSEETKKDYDILFDVMRKNMGNIDDIAKENYTLITSKLVAAFWPDYKQNLVTNVHKRMLVKREDCTDSLYDDVLKYQIVNLTALGGYGKSSLVNLLTYNYRFDYVVRVYVKGKIKEDIVDALSKFIKEKIDDKFVCSGVDVNASYESCIVKLEKVSKTHQNNLFVLDIDGECDNYSSFFEYFHQQDSGLYPDGWHVLIVSRKPCAKDNPNYKVFNINNPKNIKKDFAYLKDLFVQVSGYTDSSDDELRQMIAKLCYSPLLVRIAAGQIITKRIKPTNLITNIIKSENTTSFFEDDNINNYTDDKKLEKTVGDYLYRFVEIDNLPVNCRFLLSLFILWPATFVDLDVIYGFADKYKFEKFRRLWGRWVKYVVFEKDKEET